MSTRMYVCESAEHPTALLSGLNEQRLKGTLCDVTVRVQGHLFKAHVNVLASAMGYFRDLFSQSGKEKPVSLIEIPMIVNSTGFAKILDFVYTSQLCLSQSTVMQVLCSACYLQIPYVVEKCQEFISTHGHVTSPSSLSEVTGPLLQDLQRQNFPLTQSSSHNQSASASLSFLSQLNRISEKSRVKQGPLPQARHKNSPPRDETEERRDCGLISTPPSPRARSPTNGDEPRTSPDHSAPNLNNRETSLKLGVPFTLKRERDAETSSTDEKQAIQIYSPQDKAVVAYSSEERMAPKTFIYTSSNHHTMDVGTGGVQPEPDAIDHKSLADYFRERELTPSKLNNGLALMPYQYHTDRQQDRSAPISVSSEQLVSGSRKNINGDGFVENPVSTQAFVLQQKKEKPKKDYKCEYCGKLFGRQQHLKRHILTHTGERPYPCQYCDKRFRRSEHLKHHLVNHEQAMGIENSANRKRPRRIQRNDDAYSLSKLMLNGYRPGMEQANILANGTMPSAPVILPSMYTDMEVGQPSPSQNAVTEIDDVNTPPNDGNDETENDCRGSPSYSEHSPMIALNLSRTSPKIERKSPPVINSSGILENNGGSSDGPKPAESDQKSSKSGSSSPVANRMNFEEAPSNSDIIGIEGSEVLTSDLKQLIAAMDE